MLFVESQFDKIALMCGFVVCGDLFQGVVLTDRCFGLRYKWFTAIRHQ